MNELRVKVDPLELQVRDHPHPGAAIIFLHFSGANLMMWERAIPFFQPHYRLVMLDLRGHGKSDKPETGYHIDAMAGDIAGLMERLGIAQAHILGSSLGAEVGLSLAANHPQKVLSLVCDGALSSEYGPYGTWEGTPEEYQAHVASEMETMRSHPERLFPSLDAMLEANRQNLEKYGIWNEYVEAMVRYGAVQLADGQYTRGFRKHASLEYMGHYFQTRLEDYYRRVTCPILMVAASDVFENEPERLAMQGLQALAPRADIVQINGWDHPFGWLVDPGPVCQAILKFLSASAL